VKKNTGLAAEIEADILRDYKSSADITKCFSCGFNMVYKGRRFCSSRCREWFDAGNPGYDQDWLRAKKDGAPFKVIAGPPGIEIGSIFHFGKPDPIAMRPTRAGYMIRCAGCQREFESKGLRCCSKECERLYQGRAENLRVMAEAGIEPSPKRQCEHCGAVIPKWQNGRQVQRNKRFCSERCRKASRRHLSATAA
jgi:hypothetical protein